MATYTLEVKYNGGTYNVFPVANVNEENVLDTSVANLSNVRSFSHTEKAIYDFVRGLEYTIVPGAASAARTDLNGQGSGTPVTVNPSSGASVNASSLFTGTTGALFGPLPDELPRTLSFTFSGAPASPESKGKDYFIKFRLTYSSSATYGTQTNLPGCPVVVAWLNHPNTCQTVSTRVDIPPNSLGGANTGKYIYLEAIQGESPTGAVAVDIYANGNDESCVTLSPGV